MVEGGDALERPAFWSNSCRSGSERGHWNKQNGSAEAQAVPDKFLLDTSAFMALLENEPGADTVEQLLEAARRGEIEFFAAFASRMELLYLIEQEKGVADLDRLKALIRFWPVVWLHSDNALCDSAAALKASHRVSFTDAFVAAAALRVDAMLIHKDPQFAPLAGLVKQEMLPPKISSSATSASS
jgi:predicted nucleic acid-binding protein